LSYFELLRNKLSPTANCLNFFAIFCNFSGNSGPDFFTLGLGDESGPDSR
jgi:hypothetical protein